ncbi:cAMP-activated global transcriptional regulator CRP [Kordia antarctica]|uniref:cAMP-activated global transcriptional regulator CRP n=1 Tax=Kordia antarctica TaxID=1218801 RepID=A0A7L4ZGP7_9FLAO|nr:Crp/Fnr family transcriptional regulator [Kordia antarctica]QHI35690.1 cAMP-activated global transcriptional regulator CRP [Kordia antarctica]
MISKEKLLDFDATVVEFAKNELIFSVQQQALFYYQIKEGVVKIYNTTDDGKEFTQGIFETSQSFGEPPLFGNFPYPASAIATEKTTLYRLPKAAFFKLLEANFDVHIKFTQNLCNRLRYKSMIMKEVSVHKPEHRILALLKHLKAESKVTSDYLVKLTRQQIADLTGLRVETVIRAIKNLEETDDLKRIARKVYL